jgi:D-inositol-3-phosphate glycosyltransferase
MKRPRVALVAPGLKGTGGISRLTEFLYRSFENSDSYEVEVVSIATSSRDPDSRRILKPSSWLWPATVSRGSFKGIPFCHVGANFVELEFQRYRARTALTRILAGYDLLQFVVGFGSWGCVAAGLGRPIVMHVATTAWSDRRSRVRASPLLHRGWLTAMGWIAERYERRALALADLAIVPSEYTLAAVRRWATHDRVQLGFCGIDTDRFRPRPGVARKGIMTVGRFTDPRKNLAVLLQAYSRLPAAVRPTLRVAGEAPARFRELASRLGIGNQVEFLGQVDDDALSELYASSALFALSSDEEGLSIAIQEAMASGLPVVTTDCGGPSTIVREGITGRLTPVGDHEALAHAIQATLENPEQMRAMGAAARAFAQENFAIQRAAAVFASAWAAALAAR